jgi:predicted O-methyltransferase YrrM
VNSILNIIKSSLNGNGDSSQHEITLFAIAISLKAKNILELGVRDGFTTIPLLNACEYTNGLLTSVDIKENINLNIIKKQYPKWEYKISDAIEFISKIKDDVLYDLIFIDDWHDGNHLFNEISLLEKHITPSSIILIHDCMCYNTQPNYHIYKDNNGEFGNGGPFAAIQKLDLNVWEYSTIPVNNGLTILRKKGTILKF